VADLNDDGRGGRTDRRLHRGPAQKAGQGSGGTDGRRSRGRRRRARPPRDGHDRRR
jgi:hypothetical protein